MATPGQLVSEIARLLGLPENAVVTPWRVLREAGIVTKGARGRNAAYTNEADAGHALIAVASEIPLKSVIESWAEYAHLPAGLGYVKIRDHSKSLKKSGLWDLQQLPLLAVKALKARHTLVQALAAFIQDAANEPTRAVLKSHRLSVQFIGPYPHAYISLWKRGFEERVDYENRPRKMTPAAIQKWGAEVNRAYKGDLHQERGFTQATILGLGRLLAPAKSESAI
jgi:DNA-binding transcriptional ArsR family regulator